MRTKLKNHIRCIMGDKFIFLDRSINIIGLVINICYILSKLHATNGIQVLILIMTNHFLSNRIPYPNCWTKMDRIIKNRTSHLTRK